jgi:hypothetical protein
MARQARGQQMLAHTTANTSAMAIGSASYSRNMSATRTTILGGAFQASRS